MNPLVHVESWVRIIVLLLGLNGGPRLTQRMVAEELGLSKPTVSQHVKNMLERHYIRRIGTNRRDIFYAKGKSYHVVEPDVEAYLAMVRQDDGGMSGVVGYTPTYAIHLSGKGMTFDVLQEGDMENLTIDRRGLRTQFLGTTPHSTHNGSEWWRTLVLYNGHRFQVGYQRTPNYKILSIHVKSEVLVSSSIAKDAESCVKKLQAVVTPLLMAMEHDGWKIQKDATGNYKLRKPVFDRDIHRALREQPNEIITEKTGPFGVSGEGVWCDNSKNELEVETNEAAYIDAIVDLPKTKAIAKYVFSLRNDIEVIRQSCSESSQALDSFVEMMDLLAKSQKEIGHGFQIIVNMLTPLMLKHESVEGVNASADDGQGVPDQTDGVPPSFPLYV